MSSHILTAAEIEALAAELLEQFPLAILMRGLEYQETGRVKAFDVFGERLTAHVRGTSGYLVEIDLATFPLGSVCTCPYEVPVCKHMAAVILQWYAIAGSPRQLVESIRGPIQARHDERLGAIWANASRAPGTESGGATGGSRGTKTGVDARGLPGSKTQPPVPVPPKAPGRESPFSAWDAYLRFQWQNVSTIMRSVPGFRENRTASAVWSQVDAICREWPEPQRRLYRVVSSLIACVEIARTMGMNERTPGDSMIQFYAKMDLQMLVDELDNAIRALVRLDTMLEPEATELLVGLSRELLLFAGRFGVLLIKYQSLWGNLLDDGERIEREIAWLDGRLRQSADAPEGFDPAVGTLARVHLLSQNDRSEDALVAFMSLYKGEIDAHSSQVELCPPFAMGVMSWNRDMEVWPAVQQWVDALAPYMPKREWSPYFDEFCQCAVASAQASGQWDWLRGVLKGLRPRSMKFYMGLLIEENKPESDREWAEHHMSRRSWPSELDRQEARVLELRNPAVLLPIYHLAICQKIEEKNKDSYHLAVRWLRKLDTLYKKQKRRDRFLLYVRMLAKRYSRLRTLIGMFQKAGWLD